MSEVLLRAESSASVRTDVQHAHEFEGVSTIYYLWNTNKTDVIDFALGLRCFSLVLFTRLKVNIFTF